MARELKGWARPRPLRVAFLIEDGEHASLILDGVFADCYNRWGGRFSLIAPCLNGRIASSYWPWLEAYDPDIVYSYVPLSSADVLEVHERLYPAQYAFHKLDPKPRLDTVGFKPSYGFSQHSPLSSLSTIFRLARYRPAIGEGSLVRIIDSWHTERPSGFLTDNFGTYHLSCGGSIYPPDAKAAATLLTIVSPEMQVDPRHGVPRDLNTVPSEMVAFREFAEQRATSLSLASTLFAPKLDIQSGRWSGSFNLVVGDGFADRILFWNARLLIPAWLDRDLCCLRVGLNQLKEPEFLAILVDMLKNRNWVTSGGSQTRLTVRSVSLTKAQLLEAQILLLETDLWSTVMTDAVTGLDDIVPTADEFKTAKESNRFGDELFPRPEWTGFMWSPPMARPPATVPDHLSDAPVRQAFTVGYWCTDLLFEYDGPGPHFPIENQWMLPRRWRMARAFQPSLVGQQIAGRRSRDGNLAIFTSVDHQIETIKVPTAFEAMHHALVVDGVGADPNAEHGRVYPPNKVAWASPSNEARYLTGVLGMAGSLQRASQFLLHPFLSEIFSKLGGTPNLSADKVTPTLNFLQKIAGRQAAFDLRSKGEREALANLIVKAARALKRPKEFVTYNELKENWKTYRADFWDANSQPDKPGPDANWRKREEESLDVCLIELRRRQMVFQGHRWTCPRCHHKNSVDLAALSSELSCEVCKQSAQAPVNIRWLFRPSEFLIESLRDHSVLSLVWVLSALRERARRSLIFVKPIKFGFTYQSTSPDAEADLLVILDGQAMLCEVKSSWRDLRLTDITDFVELAKRLRPDTALLAVMEAGQGQVANLATAHAQLADEGIKFELLTLDGYKPKDDPYLLFDNEGRV